MSNMLVLLTRRNGAIYKMPVPYPLEDAQVPIVDQMLGDGRAVFAEQGENSWRWYIADMEGTEYGTTAFLSTDVIKQEAVHGVIQEESVLNAMLDALIMGYAGKVSA